MAPPTETELPLAYLEAYPYPAAVLQSVAGGNPEPSPTSLPSSTPNIFERELGTRLVVTWTNKHWNTLTNERPLSTCVSSAALYAFENWASHGEGIHTLTLKVGSLLESTLHLANTRLRETVIVTSMMPPSIPSIEYTPNDSTGDLSFLSPPGSVAGSRSDSIGSPPVQQSEDDINHVKPVEDVAVRSSESNHSKRADIMSSSRRATWDSAIADLIDATGSRTTNITTRASNATASTAPTTAMAPSCTISHSPSSDSSTTSISSSSRLIVPGSPKRPNEGHQRPQHHSQTDNFTQYDYNVQMQTAAKDYQHLLESTDWSKTALGPFEKWPPAIRTMLHVVFTSATQDSVWFGDVDNIHIFYNQSYACLVDHPRSFGRPAAEVWKTLWDKLEPFARRCYAGDSVYHHNDFLFYQKNDRGNFIERYHTWSYVPIRDENNKILGLYSMSNDNTYRVVNERRMETTQELVELLSVLHTRKQLFATLAEVLEKNPIDIPFGIFYSVDSSESDVRLTLESSVGVPHGHAASPARTTVPIQRKPQTRTPGKVLNPDRLALLDDGTLPPFSASTPYSSTSTYAVSYDRTAWPIAQALESRRCVMVDNCSEIIEGFPLRQWDELPDAAIVVPIASDICGSLPAAVLILGLNLHGSLEGDYFRWIQTLRSHITSALTAVAVYEAEAVHRLERERLERAKAAWFKGAAHEFRTPLTLIAGPIEDVLRTNLSKSQRSELGIAQRNVNRLQRLITSLLDFTKIEAGRVSAQFVPTDLGEFVTHLATLFKSAIERLQIKFVLDIEPRSELVVFDPLLLETAVSNLLSNALKYTEDGSVMVRVTYDHEYANISVIDTGRGIEPGDLEKVTEMFHRTSEAISSGVVGSGIGLALAKEIVRFHHGEMTLESSTGTDHGSVVTARIPLNLEESSSEVNLTAKFGSYSTQTAETLTWDAEHARIKAVQPLSPPPPRSESISSSVSSRSSATSIVGASLAEALLFEPDDLLLIVDDNHELRKFNSHLFRPFCNVIEAASVEAALELIHLHKPNLILSDFLMPRASGLDLVAAVRKDPNPDIRILPVVLLSAVNDDETRLEAFVAGVEDYITKPFKIPELVARIHLHMQMGKRRAKLGRLFEEREQEIAVLSDYCPSGIVRFDEHGQLTYTNAAFREPAGISEELDNNMSLWDLWRTKCDEETWTRLQFVLHDILQGDNTTITVEWKWLTGCTMSGVFIRLDKVRPGMSGIIGCCTDISYQKERLLEAERRRAEAENSREQQELLVDFTSHEIRTPVSAIIQCSSLVKENLIVLKQELQTMEGYTPTAQLLSTLDEDISALDSIYQCGVYQERIAADVLSLSSIQLDMISLHFQPMCIRHHARKVLSVFTAEAAMNKVGITLQIGQSFATLGIAAIKMDHVRLRQVLTNLIANAIRFTSESTKRHITVRYEVALSPPQEGEVRFPTVAGPQDASCPANAPEDTPVYLFVSVQDTGPGISEAERANLFQRFRQGNSMIHTRHGGSGLGLFICKKLTELLGGRIEVESTLGKGSEFRFFVAAKTAAPDFIAEGLSEHVAMPRSRVPSPASNEATPKLTSSNLPPPPPIPLLDFKKLEQHSAQSTIPRGLPEPGICSVPDEPPSVNEPIAPAPPADALEPLTTDSPSPPSASPLRVLVVEDNLITQRVLKRQLTKAGALCDVANNGQEALIAIQSDANRSSPYDIVLMDLEMPVMDGVTAVRHLRTSERQSDRIPTHQLVIAVTGNARQGQIDQAREAGMDDVVIKPYRFPALLETMKSAVRESREAIGTLHKRPTTPAFKRSVSEGDDRLLTL